MTDSTSSPRSTPMGDELDELLRAYFRSQIPAIWPPAPSPSPELHAARAISPTGIVRATPSRLRSDTLQRPRYVLAVSVITLLALGSFLIEQNFTPPSTPSSPSNSRWGTPMLPQTEASNPPVLQHLRKSPPTTAPTPSNRSDDNPAPHRPPIKLP
jgi:hypothetical protein